MSEEIVEPQEQMEEIIEQAMPDQENSVEEADREEKQSSKTMIPLSVAQKLREQKRELELELQWERQRAARERQQAPVEEDNSRYESATREDLTKSQEEAIRLIEERLWIKQNPEKYELVTENLPKFLKQRPNLVSAINHSTNRYEEAYTLMDALTPKQKNQLMEQSKPKKEAPNAPSGIPKAAAMNQTVDVMSMSDKEFAEWRQSKRRR